MKQLPENTTGPRLIPWSESAELRALVHTEVTKRQISLRELRGAISSIRERLREAGIREKEQPSDYGILEVYLGLDEELTAPEHTAREDLHVKLLQTYEERDLDLFETYKEMEAQDSRTKVLEIIRAQRDELQHSSSNEAHILEWRPAPPAHPAFSREIQDRRVDRRRAQA